jgi:hypothetical protein
VSAARVAAGASAAYALVALLRPDDVARALSRGPLDLPAYRRLARVLAVRDLVVGAGAFVTGDARLRTAGLVARIAFDAADAVVLGRAAPTGRVRAAVLGVTAASAALTAGALLHDRRRA